MMMMRLIVVVVETIIKTFTAAEAASARQFKFPSLSEQFSDIHRKHTRGRKFDDDNLGYFVIDWNGFLVTN